METPKFPGPKSLAMIDELKKLVVMEPHPFVVDLANSKGMYLATVDGQRIFDWAGYYGAKLLTHNHPGLYEPDYIQRLCVAANNKVANPDFLTPECLEYYRLLHELAPVCMRNSRTEVYAVNSGAEAVENMMKYLLVLHEEKLRGRGEALGVRRFIYFDRAFHGRTVFALNITQPMHDPVISKGFRGFVPGNIQVPFPSIDTTQPESRNAARTQHSLEIIEDSLQRYGSEIVAIILEPIQGAGGHRTASPQFFRELSNLAHKYDVYIGYDEIQTAGGQTGTVFAIDQFDLPHPPQAVAVAKKFANGALYMLHSMQNRGILDSTWGGTLADMVRFVQEWKIVRREKLIEQVASKSAILVSGLRALTEKFHDLIFNIRGMGLYQGLTFRSTDARNALLEMALQDEQLLLLGAGLQTVRLRPPLDVGAPDIELLLAKLDKCLSRLVSAAPSGEIPTQA